MTPYRSTRRGTQGDYGFFYRNTTNASTVKKAFVVMERAMIKYDADRSRTLSQSELNNFFREQIPESFTSGVYQKLLDQICPAEKLAVTPVTKHPNNEKCLSVD